MVSGSEAAGNAPGLPPGWEVVRTSGPLGFVTHVTLVGPDGDEVEWTSRRHRKLLGMRTPHTGRTGRGHLHASAMSWWMGALFGIGSICFAAASLPIVFDQISASVVAWTFAVGSVFFTAAAYIQYHETVTAPTELLAPAHRLRLRRLVRWQPHRIDWWGACIQLIGTILFNVSTFTATRGDLDLDRTKHLVWGPDLAGSICFLIACWLAYAEVNRGVLPRSDHSIGWWIAALNILGSIAFGLSAIGARILSTTGEPANIALANSGTFVGALCFLVGALLLPVESSRDATVTAPPSRS